VKPANLASRAVAVILDTLITVFGLGTLIAALTGQLHHRGGSFSYNLHGGPAWLWVAASLAYWVGFESFTGTTPAKRLFGIYVVGADGGKPSIGQALGRNLLRIADAIPFLIPYLLGFVLAVTDTDRRRIGDRAAGTRVISRT
jgi:uncharacterized RDD family membrane protein YckC